MIRRPLKFPMEYWGDPDGKMRPIVRCSNVETCAMAQRGVAWAFLDVKFPQILCKGCGNEFEYLQEHCTHPYVSFSPPTEGKSGKGEGKKGNYQSKGENGYGSNYKGKGVGKEAIGKSKGKGGKGAGKDDSIDIMDFLKRFGEGIITEEQASKIKTAMQANGKQKPQAKSQLQAAKWEFKQAIAEMNTASHLLAQSKESVIAIDTKYKAAMITVCEYTNKVIQLKEEAAKFKDNYDKLLKEQDEKIDDQLQEIAYAHSNSIAQFNQFEDLSADDSPDAETPDVPAEHDDDREDIFTRQHPEAPDIEMNQAALKRQLPPPLNLSTEQPIEEIMHTLLQLNSAKKSKSTPRGSDDGQEGGEPE